VLIAREIERARAREKAIVSSRMRGKVLYAFV